MVLSSPHTRHLLSACCLLPAAFILLPFAFCLLPFAFPLPSMPLSSSWTLTGSGAAQSGAALGISQITRRRTSQAIDTCVILADGRAMDAPPLFPVNSTVTIAQSGVPWFVGRVTSVPATGTARAESQRYELSGPWWYLEKLVCRQEWKFRGGTLTSRVSRLILGQALDGSRLTTGQVIAETLQYAIDCGAPLQIGTIDPALAAPLDEVKDVTCAEVIRKMLRWHPDCVCWFDYATTGGPTFHCRARSSLPAATLTVGQPPLSAVYGIAARPDFVAPAVVIHYEITSRVNGSTQTDVVTDAAPPEATGGEFGAVVLTVPLHGPTVKTIEQRVVTRPILDELGDPDLKDYLLSRYAGLARLVDNPMVGDDGIAITDIARVRTDGATEPDPDNPGGTRPVAANTDLGNELVEGSVTDWMRRSDAVHTERQRIQFRYTADYGDGSDPATVCGPFAASFDVMATDAGNPAAGSRTYQLIASASGGDTVPTGLASSYLAALSALQHSGRIELVEAEAGGAAGMGTVLNLAGAAETAWATMRALVVEEEIEVATGTTRITFGPAGHLSPADLTALLQVTRPGVGGRVGETASAGTGASAARPSGLPAGGDDALGLGVTTAADGAATPAPLPALQWNVVVNGQATVAFFNSSLPGGTTGDGGVGG